MDLYKVAYDFRTAWIDAIHAGEIRNTNMCRFPRGCCSFASDLLQRYLMEQKDMFTWYMSGSYGYGDDFESHAWLETYDHGTVIDITGDQYRFHKPPICFEKEVYVGPRTAMHGAFILDEPIPYSMNTNSIGKSLLEIQKDQAYAAILRRMKLECK